MESCNTQVLPYGVMYYTGTSIWSHVLHRYFHMESCTTQVLPYGVMYFHGTSIWSHVLPYGVMYFHMESCKHVMTTATKCTIPN